MALINGDENAQLYATKPHGGELVPLRVKEGHRHMGAILSEDGKNLFYTSTKGNETYLNIYKYNIESEEEIFLYEGTDAATYLLDKSPEEKSFLWIKVHENG